MLYLDNCLITRSYCLGNVFRFHVHAYTYLTYHTINAYLDIALYCYWCYWSLIKYDNYWYYKKNSLRFVITSTFSFSLLVRQPTTLHLSHHHHDYQHSTTTIIIIIISFVHNDNASDWTLVSPPRSSSPRWCNFDQRSHCSRHYVFRYLCHDLSVVPVARSRDPE